MTISYVAAFLGGALALLSPCSALLLPAFFASSTGTGSRLATHVGVFFAGLLVILVPLGLGASAIGMLLTGFRTPMIWGAGIIIAGFGLMQIFGIGFDVGRLLPGSVATAPGRAVGLTRALLLGISSGVAGFCAGPILGAVLTLAMAAGSPFTGASLMVAYAGGMVFPLLVLVIIWHHTGVRSFGRGRTFAIGSREFHTTSTLTGLLLIAVGVLFIATNGLVTLPELFGLESQAQLQSGIAGLGGDVTQVIGILAITIIAVGLWWFWPRPRPHPGPDALPAATEGESA